MYKEMAFISYYFHWGNAEVMELEHAARRKWCAEISDINTRLSPSKNKKEKNIFELRPDRG